VAAADRKYFSGVVLDVPNDRKQLDHTQTVRIHRENTSGTHGTAPENYFRFAAAIFEIGGNGPASDSRNQLIIHVGDTGNLSRTALPVCCHHGGKQSKSTGPATDRQNPSTNYVGKSPLHDPSPCSQSSPLVKISSPHRQLSERIGYDRPCSINSRPLSSPTSGRLTSSISGPLTSLTGVSTRI
jgi:hypothetical protein